MQTIYLLINNSSRCLKVIVLLFSFNLFFSATNLIAQDKRFLKIIDYPDDLPNIIIILADDMGYGDVSFLNKYSKINTPNLDKLCSEGKVFTDAHSTAAVCSPSRYSLLTGRYNWRSKLKSGVLWYWDEPLIEEDRITIGDILSGKGYSTACIGKWHLGWDWPTNDGSRVNDKLHIGEYNKKVRDSFNTKIDFTQAISNGPITRGFDYYFGDDVPGFPPFCFIENDRVIGLPSIQKPDSIFGYSNGGPMIEGWDWKELLPALTEKAAQYIYGVDDKGRAMRNKEHPFFLYFSLSAPHVPIAPADKFKGSSRAGAYGDFVQQIDWSVGRILNALDEMGLDENTLVIFTSDNGSPGRDGENMVGEYNSVRKYGHNPSYIFRGTKTDAWEGGHRVPFITRWINNIDPGTLNNEIICLSDLMATCAEIIGVSLPDNAGEDSYSLLPLLQGKEYYGNFREATVHHSISGNFAIRKGKWKLILCPGSGGLSKPRNKDAFINGLPIYQLYNLESDPEERTNLCNKYPDKVVELRTILNRYIETGRSTPGLRQKNNGSVPIFTRKIIVNNQAGNCSDSNPGTYEFPLRTIQAAAKIAGPGDTILVREGIYREEIAPSFGGTKEYPIVYMAAPGEVVSIRGSEAVSGWQRYRANVWALELDTSFFKGYNPFAIKNQGEWLFRGQEHHLGDVYLDGEALLEKFSIDSLFSNSNTWYVDTGSIVKGIRVFPSGKMTIYANFGEEDPDNHLIEINARATGIFPEISGLKYITIDGFDIRHTAPQWGDIYKLEKGAIGMRYGYGWIIQNCTIAYSRNIGISMGVTDEVHFPTKNEGGLLEGGSNIPPYNTIGHHIIRNNIIYRCGQAGIYGCYGAVASIIEGNIITETNYRNEWFGTNQAAIKILFPIDVIIKNNYIYGKPGLRNGTKGIWLDWGSQNTRVTGNIITDFGFKGTDGLKLEVNFGPVIIDNNIIIRSHVMEEGNGSVWVHNLFCDNTFTFRKSPGRIVPYFRPHSTVRAGKRGTSLESIRFINNIFAGTDCGNSFRNAIESTEIEQSHNLFVEDSDRGYESITEDGKTTINIFIPGKVIKDNYPLISSDYIGEIPYAGMKMEQTNGLPLVIDNDINGRKVNTEGIKPGPFQTLMEGWNNFTLKLKKD